MEVRERFAASGELLTHVLGKLAESDLLIESMFLSTCNRVEVFALPRPEHGGDVSHALEAVRETFRDQVGAKSTRDVAPYLYERVGDDAVRHIFRVAASLDSMVLGEPQILGQVKEAYDAAVAARTLRSYLGRCVSRAFSVAKRVRTETALGAGTVSISSVAVDLARGVFGDLSDKTVLLVGAGEMAEAAAKSLGKGAHAMRVCNRSFERAAELASHFGAAASPLDQLESELLIADVVVASTASKTFVVTKEMVRRAMKARKGRTLLFVDISVPRNVEPEVHGIDNVYVFNVDDLEGQVREGLKLREGEVAAAEAIVARELSDFTSWSKGLDVQPTVVGLRAKTRAVLITELERTLQGKLRHLGESDRAALIQMVDSATNKLLHAPTTKLRSGASDGSAAAYASALSELFELPEAPPSVLEEVAEETPSDEQASESRTSH